jgi:hypothetical protein
MFGRLKVVPDDTSTQRKPPRGGEENGSANQSTTASAGASKKETMRSLIENWQKVKRNAVKNRDITQLNTVLTGHALSVQTNGVKWLSTNHKYYEMVPKNVAISSVTEVEPNKKFTVLATVKESSKLFDEQGNKLLREAEDTYLVKYTVEKQGDKYFISDSSIEKIQTPQDAQKKK